MIIDEKRKINKMKKKQKIGLNPDKYINDNNLLSNLLLIKILTNINPEKFDISINSLLMS